MPDPATQPGTPGAAAPRVVHNREGMRDFIARLVESAQREIVAFAPQLDAGLFNTARLMELLAGFAARHRHNRARLLVEDAAQAIRDNDLLVELCRRFSEFIQLRQVDEVHLGIREMFVVADRTGYLHQEDVTRFEAIADPAGKRQAMELVLRFEEMWDRGAPPEGLHTPGLP